MEKWSELRKHLEEDAEFKFFDSLGNTLQVVNTLQGLYDERRESKYLDKLHEAKEEFYRRLDEFRKSGYTSKGKITPDSLEKFDEFKDLDWSVRENINKVNEYMHDLRR